MNIKHLVTLFTLLFSIAFFTQAEAERKIDIDSSNTTKHSTKINGKKINYTATTGTQPVWDAEGNPTASLFYTYYQRSDIKDNSARPLLISFNGGPGSASVWMHVAYTGPRVLNVDDEGYPLQPYGVKTNPYSILDVADVVFVNPVNTGYSRVLPDKEGKMPSKEQQKKITLFFVLTACYELTQIVCNNSDILLVKHYFPSYDAGLYASLALIGRVVYFVTWMFVMLLLPQVLESRKNGKNPVPILKKYLGYISLLSVAIVSFTFLFPEFAVDVLFGEQYKSIAGLLGWYALATSFFALANIFAYYFLSIDRYLPILITAVFGILQVVAIIFFHDSLLQVVMAQVYVMAALLVAQVSYFTIDHYKTK